MKLKKWRVKSWISSQIYQSGLACSGGCTTFTSEGVTHEMPRLRSYRPTGRRPYVLWIPDWWWKCQIGQGWRLRGRHRPEEPFVAGICATCLPCPDCGAHRHCEDWCIHVGGPGREMTDEQG